MYPSSISLSRITLCMHISVGIRNDNHICLEELHHLSRMTKRIYRYILRACPYYVCCLFVCVSAQSAKIELELDPQLT